MPRVTHQQPWMNSTFGKNFTTVDDFQLRQELHHR
jgi:hypothetical protein